jgi:two-component system alkaline phosphatase synthesis response regulator PhoP
VPQRILIIEDDVDVVRVVEAFLRREGFDVDVAYDGLAGLDAALNAAPDLIVLDWMLPHLDGPELLRRLRRERVTPVIMLTARTEEDDRIAGLEVGADDYVSKPFSPRELVARVKAVLRRLDARPEEGRERIEDDGLRIDAAARTVEMDGVRADVTTVEFDLLWTLASYPGRVFRRGELLDRVWGEDFAGVDRVVDVHVSNLRQKLAPLGVGERIVTVRSVGYKFE